MTVGFAAALRNNRLKIVAALAAVLLLAVGGIAYASIPGPDGVIHGCYKTSNPAQGAVIVVDSEASCPSGYAALNWNQTGPQGPTGTAGVLGYEVRHDVHDIPVDAVAEQFSAMVTCPSGKKVLGGGVTIAGAGVPTTHFLMEESYPTEGNTRWIVSVRRQGPPPNTAGQLHAFAICATVN